MKFCVIFVFSRGRCQVLCHVSIDHDQWVQWFSESSGTLLQSSRDYTLERVLRRHLIPLPQKLGWIQPVVVSILKDCTCGHDCAIIAGVCIGVLDT